MRTGTVVNSGSRIVLRRDLQRACSPSCGSNSATSGPVSVRINGGAFDVGRPAPFHAPWSMGLHYSPRARAPVASRSRKESAKRSQRSPYGTLRSRVSTPLRSKARWTDVSRQVMLPCRHRAVPYEFPSNLPECITQCNTFRGVLQRGRERLASRREGGMCVIFFVVVTLHDECEPWGAGCCRERRRARGSQGSPQLPR